MKTINVTFTDEEYKSLVEQKDKLNLNWHDFIYVCCGGKIEAVFETVSTKFVMDKNGVREIDEEKET